MRRTETDDFSPEQLSRLIAEELEWQKEQWKKELLETLYGGDDLWTTRD
ncbi:hypothetical protein [Gorillibacterium sp. sgz5001074]